MRFIQRSLSITAVAVITQALSPSFSVAAPPETALASPTQPLTRDDFVFFDQKSPYALLGDERSSYAGPEVFIQNGETAPLPAIRLLKPFPPDLNRPYCILRFAPSPSFKKDQGGVAKLPAPHSRAIYQVASADPGEIQLVIADRGQDSDSKAVREIRCFDAFSAKTKRHLSYTDLAEVLKERGSISLANLQALGMAGLASSSLKASSLTPPQAPCGTMPPPPVTPNPAPPASWSQPRLRGAELARAQRAVAEYFNRPATQALISELLPHLGPYEALRQKEPSQESPEREAWLREKARLEDLRDPKEKELKRGLAPIAEKFDPGYERELSEILESHFKEEIIRRLGEATPPASPNPQPTASDSEPAQDPSGLQADP